MSPQNCKYFPPKAKFPGNEIPKFRILSMHASMMCLRVHCCSVYGKQCIAAIKKDQCMQPLWSSISQFGVVLCHQAPQTGFQEKTVCCGLCVAGNISMSIKTDRKGFCPGKSIASNVNHLMDKGQDDGSKCEEWLKLRDLPRTNQMLKGFSEMSKPTNFL